LSQQLGLPRLSRVPLDPAIYQGQPVVLAAPDSLAGRTLRQAAETLAATLRDLATPCSTSPGYKVYPELKSV
jgi:MinD-like ATPase involved in chromosome partitioning or flagellar assembly